MCGNKRRAGMAREHAVALLQKFLLAKVRRAEAPLRMRHQLFKALVALIDWQEKRVRVCSVKHDRHTQLGRFLEHRREPLVIDPQQIARRIPQTRAQILPDFQTAGAVLHHLLEPIGAMAEEIGPVQIGPVHPCVSSEPSGS